MRRAFQAISTGLAGAAVLAVTALAGSAQAHDDDPKVARDAVVEIEVLARIQERCGFLEKPAATIDSLNLGAAGETRLDFFIDCNTPFAIGVSSVNGGFKATRTKLAGGFRTLLSYDVGLNLQTSGQALTPASCSSESLSPASQGEARCAFFSDGTAMGLSSDDRIAIEKKGQLLISWPGPDAGGARLVAGALADTITITIGARS